VSAQEGRAAGNSRRVALIVPCHVSERWFSFRDREQYDVIDEDLIHVDVMTRDDAGAPYKLCELIVARGDLLRAVAAHGDPAHRRRPVRKPPPAPMEPESAAARSRPRARKTRPPA
jgi:hypothetical protein